MDPYFILKQEVDINLQKLRTNLNNREDMLNDNRGINIEIFHSLGIQMTNDISKLKISLKDIEESIQVVRNRREDFEISDISLNSRDLYIKKTFEQILNIENEINRQNYNFNINKKPQQFTKKSNFQDNSSGDQNLLLAQHEDQINNIADTVYLQMEISKQIVNEFKDQEQIIISIDKDVDTVESAMKKVTNQIKGIIENEGKLPTFTVAILSIILILLLFWVA